MNYIKVELTHKWVLEINSDMYQTLFSSSCMVLLEGGNTIYNWTIYKNGSIGKGLIEHFKCFEIEMFFFYMSFSHKGGIHKLRTFRTSELGWLRFDKITNNRRSMTKWLQKRPEEKKRGYLNGNELIWDFWSHIGLKQPRNHSLE